MRLGKTRKQLLEELDSEELTFWRAYDAIYDLSDDTLYYLFAQLTSCLARVHGADVSTDNFLPIYMRQTKPRQTKEEIKAYLKAIATKQKPKDK